MNRRVIVTAIAAGTVALAVTGVMVWRMTARQPAPTLTEQPNPYELPASVDPESRLWPAVPTAAYTITKEEAADAVRQAIWDPAGVRWRDLVAIACRDQEYGRFKHAHEVVLYDSQPVGGHRVYLFDLDRPDAAVSRWEPAGEGEWVQVMIWPTPSNPYAVGVRMVLGYRKTDSGWCYAGPEYKVIYGTNEEAQFAQLFRSTSTGEAGGSD